MSTERSRTSGGKPAPRSTILDLGCGSHKHPGAFGVDIRGDQFDLRHDLDKTPWPLPNDHFVLVFAVQVLEHLADAVKVMEEIWRVCTHGALVVVSVPNGFCDGFVQDPDHKTPWNLGKFLYFCPSQNIGTQEKPPYEFNASFRVMDFHVRKRVKQVWGEWWYDDDLWIYLQALKEKDDAK